MSTQTHHNVLPSGYKLHWYVIGSVIGRGGFGVTYIAVDTNLDQRVAIKEFLPVELVTRSRESQVHPLSNDHADTYGWGLNRFVNEAQTLAKFRHPNIVRVLSVFEANNTAYMVMEFESGESLEKVFKSTGLLDEGVIREIIMPLLDGLTRVHEAGFIHRDIKPANIHLRDDSTPVLLDFGSARKAVGVATRTLTALVTPGYAPFEQYDISQAGEQKQGPWTDIYALGATLYRGVTGQGPPDAMARVNAAMTGQEVFVSASTAANGRYSPQLLAAIDWALEFLPEDRPQCIADWQAALSGQSEPPPRATQRLAATVLSRETPTELASPPPSDNTGRLVQAAGVAVDPEDRIAPRVDPKRPSTNGAGPDKSSAATWLLIVLLVVVAGAGAWHLYGPFPNLLPMPPPDTAAQIDTPVPSVTAPSDEAAAVAAREREQEEQARLERQREEEAAKREAQEEQRRAEVEATRKRAEINSLLRQAASDLAADRLTTPAENNAYLRYTRVLEIDPGNQDATTGIHKILARYLVLAKAATDEGNHEIAKRYLDKAATVSPGSESVASARAALENRVEEERRAKSEHEEQARLAAEQERKRLEAARRATEQERKRMQAARRAAEEERQHLEAERQAELQQQRLAEEAEVLAKLEVDFKRAQEIASLLAAAEDDLEAKRFTTPAGNNALERYRAVQSLDPDNETAKSGLERISKYFVDRADQDISKYRFKEAEASLNRAAEIYADSEPLARSLEVLQAGKAAYNGTRPIAMPPYRVSLLPVIGNHNCTGDDPRPRIEHFGQQFLDEEDDLDLVRTSASADDYWRKAGLRKEPRTDQLYLLGADRKLDGALMYWFSAVGVQCLKTHVEAYLVDLQARKVYRRKGTESKLRSMTYELLSDFEQGRQK